MDLPVVSGVEALRALPPDLHALALHSTVTYAPHPYSFISQSNPVTGEKSLQVHGACVWKLHLKSREDEEPRLVDDLAEVRAIIYS